MRSARLALAAAILLLVTTLPVAADDHVLLNDEEQRWVDSLPRQLILATEVGYHPYNFVDGQGNLSGVAGDYMDLIAERLEIEFTVKSYPTFSEVLEAAKNREVDIVPLIVAAPERRPYLDFTQPAYETQDRILTRIDTVGLRRVEDLHGLKIAMVEGYASQAEIESEHPEIILELVDTEIEGLLSVSLGQTDAIIAEVGTSSFYIQQEAISNLKVSGEMDGVDPQTIGTRSDWPMLNRIIGKGLASITDEERAAISQRWISIDGLGDRQLRKIWQRVGAIIAAIFGVLIVMIIWSMQLRRQVARRTAELRRELEKRHRLEAANERLALAVEQSAEYVLVTDTAGRLEYANLSFIEASGIGEISGRKLESLAVNSSIEKLAKGLSTVEKHGAWRGTIDLSRGDQGAMKVAMTIAPIFNADSELDGFVATARDVTHEAKLESRLRQSEKLSSLGILAGGIAHDFNNLLMPIMGYADLLKKDGDVRVADYVDGIVDASERARDLVRQILIFGRGGARERRPLDLCTEINDSKPLLDSLLPPKVELNLDLWACPAVMCDETQFQQILVNLCSNAGDAMTDEGGQINVRLKEMTLPDRHAMAPTDLAPGHYNVLRVSDNGQGMDAETVARIFDPYFTDKPRGEGTGLGLAVVHGIVTSHGGAIQVESRQESGTSVSVFLPSVDAVPEPVIAEPRVESRRGNGERILLLDDDDGVLNATENMLGVLGYKVSKWSDPVAALQAFREAPDMVDAILADFKMPHMTGKEFAEEARAARPDISVVIMSGNTGDLQGGEFDYVAKPLSLDELARTLSDLLA